MRKLIGLWLLVSLAACGAQSHTDGAAPGQTDGAAASRTDGTTTGPAAGTTTATIAPRVVDITTADGATLTARVHGSGPTAVVLSNMGDNDPSAWDAFAPLLAERGYTVLTYGYRYPSRTSSFTAAMAQGTVADLLAVIGFATQGGASRLVLVGASLGGIAGVKVAASVGAAAVIVLSSPADVAEYGFGVTDQELAALTVPKLVIAARDDRTVPHSATRDLYDRAPPPKQFHDYPSASHGVHLFATTYGDDLRQRIIDFVATNS